jgi:hypothetical protein
MLQKTETREHPLLMSGPMVRAYFAGLKTQTRRIVKPAHITWVETPTQHLIAGDWHKRPMPYGKPGDKIWFRETWAVGKCADGFKPRELSPAFWKREQDSIWFAAGGAPSNPISPRGKWRPSMFMPRWACRILPKLIGVRAERVQDISKEDAIAEGLTSLSKDDGRTFKWGIPDRDGWPGNDDDGWHWHEWEADPRKAYAKLWDHINGKRAPWASNPWVWVLEFERYEAKP